MIIGFLHHVATSLNSPPQKNGLCNEFCSKKKNEQNILLNVDLCCRLSQCYTILFYYMIFLPCIIVLTLKTCARTEIIF